MQLIDNNDIWRDYDSRVFLGFPFLLQKGLLLPRDSHGNFPFSLVNTERILLEMVATYLRKQKAKGIYKGIFRTQNHYYGYDGRGTFPTKFDCDYCYNLGHAAYALLANGATGYMAAIKDLHKPVADWQPIGIPLAPLMHLEERKGRLELVIQTEGGPGLPAFRSWPGKGRSGPGRTITASRGPSSSAAPAPTPSPSPCSSTAWNKAEWGPGRPGDRLMAGGSFSIIPSGRELCASFAGVSAAAWGICSSPWVCRCWPCTFSG